MCHIKMVHCHITSTKMSHQSETLSHHFQVWRQKCHINVMHCHITFTKVSHQSETLSHHFQIWRKKCHINVMHCHITLAFWDIFRTLRMYFRGFRGIFPWPVAFCHTKCVSGEAKIDTFQVVLGFRQRNQSQKMMKKINHKNSFHKPAPTQSRIFLSSYL